MRIVEHSGVVEAHALVMGLQFLSRDGEQHGKRLAVLVDAKVVRAAAQKGRSSAPALAYYIANCQNEPMPADYPSRGLHRRQE